MPTFNIIGPKQIVTNILRTHQVLVTDTFPASLDQVDINVEVPDEGVDAFTDDLDNGQSILYSLV